MSKLKHSTLKTRDTVKGIEMVEKNYATRLLQQLNDSRKDATFCDTVLVVNATHIPAHRTILMAGSEYFRTMFTVNMVEKQNREVLLHGMCEKAVKLIVDYLYTGTFCVGPEDIQDVLMASDMLQILPVKELCSLYLSQNIDVENCLNLLQLGEQLHCPELEEKSMMLIRQRLPAVTHTDSFLDASDDVLYKVLKDDDLCLGIQGEAVIVTGLLLWMDKDPETRVKAMSELLSLVRWKTFTDQQFEELCSLPNVIENQELKELMSGLMRTNDLPPRQTDRSLYVIGGYLQSRTGPMCPRLSTVEVLDIPSLKWRSVRPLPVSPPSFVFPFCFRGRLLCVILTYTVTDPPVRETEDILEYCPVNNIWKNSYLPDKAQILDIVFHCVKDKGTIYFDKVENNMYAVSYSSVSCMNFKEESDETLTISVKELEPLDEYRRTRRSAMCAAVCCGVLYCIGGYQTTSQTEMYPQADVFLWNDMQQAWIQKASMIEPRASFALVEMKGMLYAIGGYNKWRLRFMEMYDPSTDCWTSVKQMEKPRSHLTCVVAREKVYVLGGKSYSYKMGGARKVLNLCEIYDSSTDQWSPTPEPMSNSRCLAGAVVL